ncbi:aldose epimerase family protein [Thalassotalea sp. SU-HH00458]|uniref:aldose epimerase family protein n=1 Tax=Thalassotalea sp. SU-HH00458 TaxID=3127657 RepID=UPI0031060CBB
MKITQQPFGKIGGNEVELYQLTNDNGMSIKITNYGGIVTSLNVPDSAGNIDDIVCGFDDLSSYFSEEYINNAPYFGGIIGRYAARVKDGSFELNDQQYSLATNNAPNHLHGGNVGFDKQIWQAKIIEEVDEIGLSLSLVSVDGDEGYPGNLSVEVQYRLTNTNAFKISYKATTDAATPLSLTNHSYFNLTGFNDDIKGHELQIASNQILLPDETNVPVGPTKVVTGIENFIEQKRLGNSIDQLEFGFEHYYVFDKAYHAKHQVAQVFEPKSGRVMKVVSSEPGMLFYTGHFTSNELKRESGQQYGQYRAMCFETSKYPNGPNISQSPKSVLLPHETYFEETEFHFSW